MAASTESLDTSGNSHPQKPTTTTTSSYPFSFSSTTSSFMPPATAFFTDLFAADDYPSAPATRGLSDRIAERTGSGVPKFKSIPPPSLPISPPMISPSYFAIPPGLSPAELLDSPVLLSSSYILPSPTTGTFPAQSFNWKSSSNNHQLGIKQEEKNYSDFSFQTQTEPPPSSTFQSQNNSCHMDQKPWNYHEPGKQDGLLAEKDMGNSEYNNSVQSYSPEISTIQKSNPSNGGFQSDYSTYSQPSQRKSDDGYNWRKYGQKQVKGSENPRSYYKCTYPACPTKKKVERSLDGQITEIVYKGSHNHSKPQNSRRSSSSSVSSQVFQSCSNPASSEITPDQSYASHVSGKMDSGATPENSSISIGDDDFDQSSQKSKSGQDELDEDEPVAKRWKQESESEGISAPGSRTVREPRVVVQTTSDIDILDDGYRWRKYGQKVVKGNPNPRSYYKCTYPGCPVRKHVERASHDLRSVITTYEGKHNHDVPAARGSGGHSVSRPLPSNNVETTAIRPLALPSHAHNPNNSLLNSICSSRPALPPPEGQAPFTLEMLQSPGSLGFSGLGNSVNSYMNQPPSMDSVFSRAKEEPRDDMFLESLLR